MKCHMSFVTLSTGRKNESADVRIAGIDEAEGGGAR